jgi:iron-sulfur cluster assembly protein
MAITLSPAAAERATTFLAKHPGAAGMRLGVKRTGCSGWSYVVDVAGAVAPDDRVFEDRGVRIVVDADSLALVDGTEIGFERSGLSAQFVFRNPNVVGACGCGESFTVG